MFLEIVYKPTSLFSLKHSSATNSAGKSLISPSPYSVKMALLNAIITFDSLEAAKDNFELIRDLEIKFCLSDNIVVNNCMIRILKDNDKVKKEVKEINPFKTTIAFREYVYLGNEIKIAVYMKKEDDIFIQNKIDFLKKWFMHINYFGKKGCFFQFVSTTVVENIADNYSKILDDSFPAGTMFKMDDVEKSAKFDNLNNYFEKKINAKRKEKIHIFPLSLESSNKNYSHYKKI